MATKPGDGDIATQKRKKREENMWQFYRHSLVLFPRQLLAVVVVIVYGFGRHFALRFFFLLFFFLTVCVEERVEVFSVSTFIHPSIASIVLLSFFSFFSFVAHNEN